MIIRISFAWWNTSLSPLGNRRSTPEQRAVAQNVILYLTNYLHVDCLALGEMTTEDINDLLTQGKLIDYEFYDGTLKTGRLQFDTGVLYCKDKFQLIGSKSLISTRGLHSLKVANRVDFLVANAEKPFHVFVSHWPSRLWCEKNGADRHLLGVRLRDAVEELHKLYGNAPNTILLGDFNDEPFDASLSEQLLAARDRRLVRKNPVLLYNPFWRCLGEPIPHVPGTRCLSYSGSYFHASGAETHWRTFDQIIFSSAFLGQSEWQLNENYTQILQFQPFDDFVSKTNEIFDHFPVISVIEREGANG